MKTKIGRRAKSALAILLTLCMVLSVFTVGIASASAATVDSESVGSDFTSGKVIYFDNSWTQWSKVYLRVGKTDYNNAYQMSKVAGTNNIYSYTIPSWSGYAAFAVANNCAWTGSNSIYKVDTGDSYDITASTNYLTFSVSSNIMIIPKSTNNTSDGCTYYNVCGVGATTASTSSQNTFTTLNKSVSVTSVDHGTVSVAYTSGSGGTITEGNSANVLYGSTLTVTQTADTGYAAGSYTGTCVDNSSSKTISNGTTCYIGYCTTTTTACTITGSFTSTAVALPTPTWSSASVALNSGTAATLTVSNHSTIKGQDSGVTYVLKKGSATLTDGTDYTFNNDTGVFTLNDTTTAAAGSYTVQAIAANTGTYSNSAVSEPATVTVYEPMYAISGNHVGWGAYLIDTNNDGVYDVDPADENNFLLTKPSGNASYFNTWQDVLAIDTPTATPGVYSFTFKTKEKADYDWDGFNGIGLCLYQKDTAQRAFIKNGTAYNTSGNDLTITDAGIVDGDNLYVNNLGNPAGGSLVLKRGQTYTITIDQTQRYNNSSSYPWGKITITTSDVFADVAAKKQVFNATTGAYEAVADAESTIGTATAVPLHSAGSLTTVLTAVDVNHNYDFMGWYSDAECTNQLIAPGDCTKSDYTYTKQVTINTTTEYYALFKQKTPNQYDVDLVQPSSGVVSTTGGVSGGKAYQGATVSVNATVTDTSKEFSHWVITNTASGVDITSTFCANPTLAATTFTMPAANVTVTAMYKNRTVVNVNVTSSNNALGTASYNTAATYYVGDNIPITATNGGGVFSRWVVTGGTVADANSATTTIKATGATVTARAVFDYKTYQLYYNGKYYPLIRQDDGSYVSSFKIPSNSSDFTVYNASDKKYAVSGTGSTWEFNAGTRDATIYNNTTANNSAWASSVGKQYKNTSAGAAAYMVFYPPGSKVGNTTYGNGRISLVTTNPLGTIAQLYAKDGSIRYADGGTSSGGGKSSGEMWSDGGVVTAMRGVTKITKINNAAVTDCDSSKYPDTVANSDHLKIYSAPIGSTITIQTTVNETYKAQGFYVGMFVINGWKVAATDAGKGVYTATYTLTDEYAENNLSSEKSFEITPVYYNTNFKYVTFYVDADSVPEKWKGTISTCADYRSTDGTSAGSSHFEGSYPGQPLGREGDLYEIKVAKYYYDRFDSSTGKWVENTNFYPSATITAYNYDSVHHYYYVYGDDNVNTSNNKNYQTYDFADFSYLAQIDKIEAILFRCKYETSKNNWQIYNVTDDKNANYDPNATEPSWYNVSSNTGLNTWQWLTDYYGNPVDAFGNRIVKSGSGDSAVYYTAEDLANLSTTTNDQVRIVSYGNKMSTGTATVRTKAQWATGWVVYTKGTTSGTKYFKAYGTPADFICTTPGDTSTANAKYYSGASASDIKGKLTIISYDKERTNKIANVGDTGERIDGQWYYSAQHDFDSTVQVHITTQEGTAITSATVDADSNSANNTGWIGNTSKTKATLDGETTHTYSNVTTEAALNCTPGSGYTFVGWYIYDGTNYTKIHDNFTDHNTTMTMKKNYTIVAVVRKVGAGDLVITHSRYTGSKPDAHDGTGKYYVSAVVKHNDGTTTPYAEVQNSLTITGLKATDKLTISIHTVCNGADTFYAWYEEALGENYSRTGNYYEICDENVDPLGETDVSYTFFEADCSTFFSGGTLARNTIDLYSDIVHVSAYATLTYKYYDRFEENGKNQMVSYVVRNVPLDDDEITKGYIPSDEKITKYAPNVVDTIYTDTKWAIVGTKVERAASNVTLMATQSAKDCFVQYLPYDTVATNLLNGDTETPVTEVAAWNTRRVPFNSWMIDENADVDNWDPSDFYVTAPETYTKDNITWKFVRFDVYAFDRMDSSGNGVQNKVIYSTNDNIFGYRIYADCVIYPVYTKETASTALAAKAEPAVLNREVYGESTNLVDKLYADLLISYINVAAAANQEIPEVIRDNTEPSYTIETGVILDKSVDLTPEDYNTLKHAGEARDTDTTQSIISGYSGFVPAATVESFAKTATAEPGKSVTGTGDAAKLTKYVNKNADLTNKNRLDKVFRYDNKESIQKRVTAAYSYIIIKRNNEIVGFAISDAQLFNFAYLGNKPLEKVAQ